MNLPKRTTQNTKTPFKTLTLCAENLESSLLILHFEKHNLQLTWLTLIHKEGIKGEPNRLKIKRWNKNSIGFFWLFFFFVAQSYPFYFSLCSPKTIQLEAVFSQVEFTTALCFSPPCLSLYDRTQSTHTGRGLLCCDYATLL